MALNAPGEFSWLTRITRIGAHATETPYMSLEISRHDGELASLAPTWTSLLDPSSPGAAFRSYAWLASWWRQFGGGRAPHVLVAREEGRVIGLLPLYAGATTFGAPARRFMGDGIVGSDYLGVVGAARDEPCLARAFARSLLEEGASLHLDGLHARDPLVDELARDPRSVVETRFRCPHLTVDRTADFDAYLRALPEGTGAQWRRRRRWLEKRPGYRVEVLRTPAELTRGMELLLELHRARWALDGGSQAIDDARVERFHRDAALALAELGWARLYVLSADHAPRAVLYGFQIGSRFAFYQAGHDPAWRPRSVGTVLLGHVIEACFREGIVEFDFLRGSEPYKRRWAQGERATALVRCVSPGLRGRLDEAHRGALSLGRNVLRRVLPERLHAMARAARRRVMKLLP